jgi:hypothetical protein
LHLSYHSGLALQHAMALGLLLEVWLKPKSVAADAVLSSLDIPTGNHSPTQIISLQAHQYTH